jgi:hypothetical protein
MIHLLLLLLLLLYSSSCSCSAACDPAIGCATLLLFYWLSMQVEQFAPKIIENGCKLSASCTS